MTDRDKAAGGGRPGVVPNWTDGRTEALTFEQKSLSTRYCRSLHTQLLRAPCLASPPTRPPCHGSASLGRCAHGPWLALAGWLLSNTVSLDISFSSREHVTRCSLGRATRWACSIGFSGRTPGSVSLPSAWVFYRSPLFFNTGWWTCPCRSPPASGLWSKPRVVALKSIKGDGLEGSEPSQPTVVPSGIMLAPFFVVAPRQGALRSMLRRIPCWEGRGGHSDPCALRAPSTWVY